MNLSYRHDREKFEQLAETALPYERVCGSGELKRDLVDPATWLRIEQQKSWPSCGGHSLSSATEYLHWLKTGDIVQLSRMFAWVESQKQDGRPSKNDGITIWSSVQVIKKIGLPLEELAPYQVGNWYTEFSEETYGDANTRKAENHYKMKSVEDIRDFVKSGMGGILCGVPWDFNMRAWHAVPILHVTNSDKFKGPNSWPLSVDKDGPKDGFFEWSEEKLDRYINTRGTVFYGISDLSTPQVRGGNWLRDGML